MDRRGGAQERKNGVKQFVIDGEVVVLGVPSVVRRKPPRRDALYRSGLMVENCTYGQPYDQCAETT